MATVQMYLLSHVVIQMVLHLAGIKKVDDFVSTKPNLYVNTNKVLRKPYHIRDRKL